MNSDFTTHLACFKQERVKPYWFYIIAAFGMWSQLKVSNRSDVLIKVGVSHDKMKRRRQIATATLFDWKPVHSRKTVFASKREAQWIDALRQYRFRPTSRGEYFLVPIWLPNILRLIDANLSDEQFCQCSSAILKNMVLKLRAEELTQYRILVESIPDVTKKCPQTVPKESHE